MICNFLAMKSKKNRIITGLYIVLLGLHFYLLA